ncbi:stage V sporulation protein R [Povalibacter uvarum]|uniref:Stage V sporulation protein R n=1 Tax=Povalibacter uvarum TaxID=732238 RepID=A0A841HMS3_9GAMM|nr:SpoVR family protein [Povalibacter uvarum]MBB6093255.1 stage V sporulation protein R [Povalibacter uvarum]
MPEDWQSHITRIEQLARSQGMRYDPVEFEVVPESFMTEIAIYGLPVRMPHWSFGVRYIYQLIQHRMGLSRLFEVVFPGNPGRAYLAKSNSYAENVLVTAHVLGHADFSSNNMLFRRSQAQVGEHIVEQAAAHARQIGVAIQEHGLERVELVLDAALSLEQHIDIDAGVRRSRYADLMPEPSQIPDNDFARRYASLGPDTARPKPTGAPKRAPVPPHPEKDLLWFIANYAPDLEPWERDIFLAVREESFYFYPVFACQIMNEGWASFWHARLLREADFLPQSAYVDAIKCHSDVVRPTASGENVALQTNPYHLGFSIWENIVEERGLEGARKIMCEDDDFAFVRNHLTFDLAKELKLFHFKGPANGTMTVQETDLPLLHDALLAPKYGFGAPTVSAARIHVDGKLELIHDHATDGRGLDPERGRKVLEYIARVWRRPVTLTTVDNDKRTVELAVSAPVQG